MDGFSRRVLAWTLQSKLSAEGTRTVLKQALATAANTKVNVLVNVLTDGGCENTVIGTDDELSELAKHVVAQVDIAQSNSLIERLWFQLRHQWLYLQKLDSFAALERLIATHIEDHNTRIPTMVLGGRTPDEAYFGREADLPQRLRAKHGDAQRQRIATNQALSCSACAPTDAKRHPLTASSSGPVP